MEAALAEMGLEEMSKDLDDDNEFVNVKGMYIIPVPLNSYNKILDEEDVFESDFASTDEEEANQEDLDAGEKAIRDEEKTARKVHHTPFISTGATH